MTQWFLQSSISERALLFGLIIVFCTVMFASFQSLTRSHAHVTWYRGLHTAPLFQLLMWIGIIPFVIPAVIVLVRRKRALRHAPYIGNLRSRIFHARDCEYQRRINSDLLRYPLNSREEGERYKFKPCNWCIHGLR